jgi:hypothetical protein
MKKMTSYVLISGLGMNHVGLENNLGISEAATNRSTLFALRNLRMSNQIYSSATVQIQ